VLFVCLRYIIFQVENPNFDFFLLRSKLVTKLLYWNAGASKHLAIGGRDVAAAGTLAVQLDDLCFGTVNSRCTESSIATQDTKCVSTDRFLQIVASNLRDFQYGGEVRELTIFLLKLNGYSSSAILMVFSNAMEDAERNVSLPICSI